MIRFLIELLVRRTWFGQFDELYFVLSWLVMRCKLRPELAADSMIESASALLSHQKLWSVDSCDFVPHNYETLKWLSSLPTLNAKSLVVTMQRYV